MAEKRHYRINIQDGFVHFLNWLMTNWNPRRINRHKWMKHDSLFSWVFLGGLTNCTYTLLYLISIVKIGTQKRLMAVKMNSQISLSPSLSIQQRYALQTPSYLKSEVRNIRVGVWNVWGHWRNQSGLTPGRPWPLSQLPTGSNIDPPSMYLLWVNRHKQQRDVRPATLSILTITGNLLFLHWRLHWEYSGWIWEFRWKRLFQVQTRTEWATFKAARRYVICVHLLLQIIPSEQYDWGSCVNRLHLLDISDPMWTLKLILEKES